MSRAEPAAASTAQSPQVSVGIRVPIAAPSMPRALDIAPYLDRIDQSGWYSNFGPIVSEFEARLESRFPAGTRVITTVNGTLGLTLALEALSLPPGSLCALPSWTFVATAHAVRMARLVPWFVDVDPAEGELTPDLLRQHLASAPGKVTAAIPVAVMGRPLDLAAWRGFQDDTGVRVVVDAAAGFDAARSAPVPVMVSLHATKALGIGEGAFIATEDHQLSQRLRAMTNFGFLGDRISRHVATNAKLSEYAAAVGLAALDLWACTRSKYLAAARRLRRALVDEDRIGFQGGWGLDWISSTCVVRLPMGSPEAVEAHLRASGIDTRRWWSEGCHLAPAFLDCPRSDLRVTEELASSSLGIPFFADLHAGQINDTAAALRSVIDGIQPQARSQAL